MKLNLLVFCGVLALAGCVENADPVRLEDGHRDRRHEDGDARTVSGSAGSGGAAVDDVPDAVPTPQVNQPVDDDNDGYTRTREVEMDCDDSDPDVNPGADEVCDDNVDNDCDGQVDEGCDDLEPEPEPNPGEHLLVIRVNAPYDQLPALDFSYGYCSDVRRAEDCDDWHQSVARTLWGNQVQYSFRVLETGWVRLNSSYFEDSEDVSGDRIVGAPDRWLCEDFDDPTSNGSLTVWLDNELVDTGQYLVPFQNGCSAAINVAELLREFAD